MGGQLLFVIDAPVVFDSVQRASDEDQAAAARLQFGTNPNEEEATASKLRFGTGLSADNTTTTTTKQQKMEIDVSAMSNEENSPGEAQKTQPTVQ